MGPWGSSSHRLIILIRTVLSSGWENEAAKRKGDLKVALLGLKPAPDFGALRGAEAPLFHEAARIRAEVRRA
jgi:hypothetical protein